MSNPRPTVTEEMIRAAIMKVAPQLAGDMPTTSDIESVADSIQRVYHRYMDGFDIAKALDCYESWDTTRDEMEALDAIDMEVDRAHRAAEKQWGIDHPMAPPLPVGAMTTRGLIAGIYEYQPAYYCIKETGCTDASRHLLVKFEDARAAA
ncbi:hypothetical protein VLK31_34765 [Variovorax sp. H27-G14]|uniref:hypothetical protein n=1 Tax=Variovorax sp. H27-G14 TaxID=3111914 RepID=UPI0038FCFAB3